MSEALRALSPALRFVTVMVACNDDAGNCSERAAALRIELPEGDYAYDGAGVYGQGDGPVCRHGAGPANYNGDGQLRLGRFRYRTVGHTAWLGNMAWDGFKLSEPEARRLKADQERSGWWQVTEQPVLPATAE